MKGFTLIEMMIVVAVMGILAAIAFPSYQNSVRKSNRTDAKQALVDLGQKMERYYTEKSTYATATIGAGVASTDVLSSATTSNGYYTLRFSAQSTSSYTATAAPTTKGGQNLDACGTLTLTSTGVQGVSGGSLDAATCW